MTLGIWFIWITWKFCIKELFFHMEILCKGIMFFIISGPKTPDVHYDVIKWKYFLCYCPFVWWPVDSPHKVTVIQTFDVYFLLVWTNSCTNIRPAIWCLCNAKNHLISNCYSIFPHNVKRNSWFQHFWYYVAKIRAVYVSPLINVLHGARSFL